MGDAFHGLVASKQGGTLRVDILPGTHDGCLYTERASNVAAMIREADRRHGLDFEHPITFSVEDSPIYNSVHRHSPRTLSFCTDEGEQGFDRVYPDFVFESWNDTGATDYEVATAEIARAGDEAPASDALGWRGADTNANRITLTRMHDGGKRYDCKMMSWFGAEGGRKHADFVSLADHPRRWRYLIDVEGRGYSARLKLLFFAKRVIFLQDRPWKEWFYEHLVPWVHYVPVARDLSDLDEKLRRVEADPALEAAIVANATAFARTHLTKDAALRRIADVVSRVDALVPAPAPAPAPAPVPPANRKKQARVKTGQRGRRPERRTRR